MVEKAHLSVRIPKELMKDLKIAAIKKVKGRFYWQNL
mgnify:CR=1 FL=1